MKEDNRGFTLIEILVVMTIFIFIAGFGLIISMDSYRSNNFRSEQELLYGLLLRARSQAITNINQKPHGVYIYQDPATHSITYTLFQGSPFAGRPSSDTDFDITYPGSSLDTVGGSTAIIFKQLTGATAVASVSLDDHSHPVYNLCLNAEGQINAKTTCP